MTAHARQTRANQYPIHVIMETRDTLGACGLWRIGRCSSMPVGKMLDEAGMAGLESDSMRQGLAQRCLILAGFGLALGLLIVLGYGLRDPPRT